ncbi:MAG: hypothetical protein JXR07_15905 [Reichenbachiella sp.]
MKRIFSLALIMILAQLAYSQAPAWVSYETRTVRYSDTKYLVGFSSEKVVRDDQPREDLLEKLSGYAKDKLVQSVLTEIKSTTTMSIQNTNGVTNEELKSASVASANATIAGLKVETYYEDNKKDDFAYAFAYASKADVIKYYENDIKAKLDKFSTDYSIAENNFSQGNNQKALKALFGIQTDLGSVAHGQMLLVTMTGNYNLPSLKRNEINAFKSKVESKINEISSNQKITLEDAAYFIAFSMSTQMDDKSQPIVVNNFTFEDTPMGSRFSRRLQAAIGQKLTQEGFGIAENIQNSPGALILKGTYWENGDKLKITSTVRTQATSQALASAECFMPIRTLESIGVAYKPENYKQAMIDQKIFAENEIVGGNMNVEIWTNKGKDNLIYTEGEELKLFIRANKECYIRVVYYFADGSKYLMIDNYYINRDIVNKTYEYPETFECAGPFGVETLQLNAQVDPFDPLNVDSDDFIVDDTQTIQVKSRGFKKKKSTAVEDIKAERRLVFTTMSN